MAFRFLVVMVSVVLIGHPVAAQGLYAGAQIGSSFVSDSTIDDGTPPTEEMTLDSGFSFVGSFGMAVGNNIRVEAEFGYAVNEADTFFDSGGIDAGSGDISAVSFMANAFYDYRIPNTKWTPFAGIGLGFVNVSFDNVIEGNSFFADDDDTAFAWQFGGGVAYKLSPKIDLVADYRYFGTAELSFVDVDGDPFTADYDRHTIRFGARYNF